MLKQLYINNFTLIDRLEMEFFPGFSVITGETGAGKSIILGAISLLMGQRADTRVVKNGTGKCTIEAHFDIGRYDMRPFFDDNDIEYDGDDCILRRELSASGKSRSFINDTPVTLAQMRTLGQQLYPCGRAQQPDPDHHHSCGGPSRQGQAVRRRRDDDPRHAAGGHASARHRDGDAQQQLLFQVLDGE